MSPRIYESFGFCLCISDIYTLCIDSLCRTERLKTSIVRKLRVGMSASFFVIISFLVLHSTNRSTVPIHQPLLSLSPDICDSESIYSLRCSQIIQKQYYLANIGYQILRQRKETTHNWSQLPQKINHLETQRQIGDSQPFSPLELITMYPE